MSARIIRRSTPHRRRLLERGGALLTLVLMIMAVLPLGAAWSAVRTYAGMRGTVLGRSAWYGTYYLTGIGPALCIDADKAAPDETFAYKRGTTITGTLGGQLAFTATKYGGTTDTVTAIAAKLVMHDLMNARYPYGEVDVMKLQPSQLANFGGRESAIVTKARAVMSDVLAHYRLAPYRLTLKTPATLDANNKATVSVTLLDGRGMALPGFKVTLTGSNTTVRTITVTTGSTGKASATFTAVDKTKSVRITGSATLPSALPVVYAPTRADMVGRAQRVVIGGTTPLTSTTTTAARDVAPPPDTTVTVTVTKTGDATAYHSVLGAQFELHADTPSGPKLAGPVTVTGPAGATTGTATFANVITTDVDTVWLVETAAPAGYALADPIAVATEGTVKVTVEDAATRGTATLVKTDATTDDPVAGAVLHLRYDSDNDGTFDTDLGTVTSAPTPVTISGLLPGRYQVIEETPPPGYVLPDDPEQIVLLAPGGQIGVTFADLAQTTVGFAKTPTGTYDPEDYSLAGALFVVRDETDAEVGRCTTGSDGRCTLPDRSLLTGSRYCWTEPTPPPGFAPADGDCFTATHPSEITVIGVAEQGTYATVAVTKHPAGDRLATLAGATYELRRQGVDKPLHTATTGDDGTLRFPPVLPGYAYCVVEVAAPPGYQIDETPHCTDWPLTADVAFELSDEALPTPTPAASVSPTAPSPTGPAPTTAPATTPPATSAPETTTPPAVTPQPVPPETGPTLPRTGLETGHLASVGVAALLAGCAAVAAGSSRRRYIPRHARSRFAFAPARRVTGG